METMSYMRQRHAVNNAFLHGAGVSGTDALIRMMDLKGGERILDFGCGTGATLVRIKSRHPSYIISGVDLCFVAREKSKKRLKLVGLAREVKVFDDCDSFGSEQFDIVYAESVFGILNPKILNNCLNTIDRTLSQDGRLLINDSIWNDEILELEKVRINKFCTERFGVV